TLLTIFALLAVGLALVGIYGVTAYAVTQRTRELGIRMALGARGVDVVGLLMRESLRRVGVGVGLGLLAALGVTRALSAMLFEVAPRDAVTFAATAILILGLGIGMASAVFTVFQAVVLRRLPVQDQDRIVELSGVAKGAAREVPLPLDPFHRFRQESRTLQSVGGFAHWGSVSAPVMDGDRPLL